MCYSSNLFYMKQQYCTLSQHVAFRLFNTKSSFFSSKNDTNNIIICHRVFFSHISVLKVKYQILFCLKESKYITNRISGIVQIILYPNLPVTELLKSGIFNYLSYSLILKYFRHTILTSTHKRKHARKILNSY